MEYLYLNYLTMKTFLFIGFIALTNLAFCQISFNTGSAELDADLNDINASAELNLGGFKAELSASYNVSSKDIDGMFSIGMEAGEVFLALEISSITDQPVDKVVTSYKSNKSKGWGYIAKEMGIKPGSPEFHELKGNSKNKKNKGSKGNGNNGNGNGNGKKK